MKWAEISIHTTNEAIEPISNILHEAGAGGVVIEDSFDLVKEREDHFGEIYELAPEDYPEEGVIIKAYFPVNSFLKETIEEIKQSINNLMLYDINIGKNTVTISEMDEEDWSTAWKKYYRPVKVSERFTIVPTWEEYTPAGSDELIIELDPGMAFGTGTHPTTVMCIRALEKTVRKGDTVIDVGTGSGVLSIASALLGAEKVLALDLDEVAVRAANDNVRLNHVQNRVTVKKNNLLDGIAEKADVIVANILAEVILRLIGEARENLRKDGYFIASGIIPPKKEMLKEELEKAGFDIVELLQIDDWLAFICRKK